MVAEQSNISVDYLALLLSVIAIILSFVSLWYRNNFYKKSLRPLFDLSITENRKKQNFEINLHNKGIGPGTITKFSLELDKTSYNIIGFCSDFANHVHGIILDLSHDNDKKVIYTLDYSEYEKQTVLSPGDSNTFFKLFMPNHPKLFESVMDEISHVQVVVEYKSIYNEKFTAKINS